MRYEDLIQQFMFQSLPTLPVGASVKFEAIVAQVFGTKQRRFGPMPLPETQVAIRDVIRQSGDHIVFFLPWGASKQDDGADLDVAEFMAVKQLRCLSDELARLGVKSTFYFRMEDLTDRYLFGDGRFDQIMKYMADFRHLVYASGIKAEVRQESWYTHKNDFDEYAKSFQPVFHEYLLGKARVSALKDIGWVGDIPQEQRDYYYTAYRSLYPDSDERFEASKYFAATLARVKLHATCAPSGPEPHLLIAFTHPVPGNPVNKPRLYFRTIPERYTNTHKSPWLAKAYFEIEDGTGHVTPRFGRPDRLQDCVTDIGGVTVRTDYVLS